MGPGVPGMGIASIFYVTAALIAPLREAVKSIRGESSAERWAAVGRQFAMAVGIISSIVVLYLGFDALVSRGVFGPPQVIALPGSYPVWTYAVGVMIVLMLALALASGVVALRVRWGSLGEDPEQIADVYRASIPVHEDLLPEGVSKDVIVTRHRRLRSVHPALGISSRPPLATQTRGGYMSADHIRYQAMRNRETGTHVTVEDAYAQGFHGASGRWRTVCWTHREIADHRTLALARAAAPHPLLWCESCIYDHELTQELASMEASIAEMAGTG